MTPLSAHGPGVFLPNAVSGLEGMIDKHKRNIERAAILGVGSITFHMASVEGFRDNETERFIGKVGREAFDRMNATTLYELARHAAGYGMAIAIENRDQGQVADYCKTIGALKTMIERVGKSNVGICLDSGHANTHQDLDCAAMIREAGQQLIDTHFHDNYGCLYDGKIWGNGVINDLHRPPGIGTIDWLAVMDALEAINYKRPIMFEVNRHTENDDLDTLLRLTRDNWRLMIEARNYIRENNK